MAQRRRLYVCVFALLNAFSTAFSPVSSNLRQRQSLMEARNEFLPKQQQSALTMVAPGVAAAAGAITGGFFAGGLHAVAGECSC